MNRPTDLADLSPRQWEELQSVASHYDKAWRDVDSQGGSVTMDGYLPPPGAPLRTVYLHELIKTDLEIRWRRHLPTCLEHYVRDYPELGTPRELPAELIYEEYHVRQVHGDAPALESYRTRFPEQFGQLERLLQQRPLTQMNNTPPPPMVPVPAELTAGTDVGHGYVLKRQLGEGQFGQVWEAVASGDVPCAVKILSWSNDQEQSKTERKALELIKTLKHPYILRPNAFWDWGNRLVIATDLADGSLGDRLRACKAAGANAIPLPELLEYMQNAAEGLDCLHAHRLTHRDVKPANLLYIGEHALVADCGLVRLQPDSMRTQQGSAAGTRAYMAPEAWNGKAKPASDQYGLALTYAELRQGHPLRVQGSDELWMFAVGEPELSAFVAAEARVIQRALEMKPQERYTSCREFVEELKKALATKPRTGFFRALFDRLGPKKETAPPQQDKSTDVEPEDTRAFPVEQVPSTVPPSGKETPQTGDADEQYESIRDGWPVKVGPAVLVPPAGPGGAAVPGPPTKTHPPAPPASGPHARTPAPEPVSGKGLTPTVIPLASGRPPAAAPARKATPSAVRRALDYALLVVALGAVVGVGVFTMMALNHKPAPDTTKTDGPTEPNVVAGATDKPGEVSTPRGTEGGGTRQTERERPVSTAPAKPPEPPVNPVTLKARQAIRNLQSDLRTQRDGGIDSARDLLTKASGKDLVDLCGALVDAAEKYPQEHLEVIAEMLSRPDLNLAREAVSYATYAHALRLDLRDNKPVLAAAELLSAFQGGTVPPALKGNVNREKEAARILGDAAASLRDPESGEQRGLDQPFRKDSMANADTAFQWLRRASELLDDAKAEKPLPLRVNLALAAWYGSVHHSDVVLALTHDLLDGAPGSSNLAADEVRLRVAAAQAEADNGDVKAALAGYESLLPLIRAKGTDDQFTPQDWDRVVLQPATQLAGGASANKQLARVHAERGKLLAQYNYLKWSFDPAREAYGAYKAAARLDPEEPDYVVQTGYAALRLRGPDLEQLEKDSRRAIDLDKGRADEPRGYGLLGRVLLEQSRAPGVSKEAKLDKLRKSASASWEATERCPQDREAELSGFLINHSVALLELGNFDLASRKKSFNEARKSAERATTLKKVDYPEYAWEALGNVCEDIAFFLGEKPEDNYTNAAAAFTKAIEWQSDRVHAWLGRGRTEYRWAQGRGQNAKQHLDDALKDLKEALKHRPTRAEEAECYFWRGLIYACPWWPSRNLAEARKDFERAVALQKEAPEWAANALEEEANLALAEAELVLLQGPKVVQTPARLARDLADRLEAAGGSGDQVRRIRARSYEVEGEAALAQARAAGGPTSREAALKQSEDFAAKLDPFDPANAARIRGASQEVRGDKDAALKAYGKGLPKDLSLVTADQDRLLLARGVLRGERFEDFPGALADCRRAAAVATVSATKASAAGFAGIYGWRAGIERGVEPAQKQKYHKQAAEDFEASIDLWPDNPIGWLLRWRLGELLVDRAETEPPSADRDALCEKARPCLARAERDAPGEAQKRLIGKVIERLDKLGQK